MSASTYTISPAVHERNIPLEELCVQNEGKRITVGIAIVTAVTKAPSSPTGSLQKPKLLLLQRAANEDAYPNMYELPGGNWEKNDETILHTVAREAFEETGLVVTSICTEFDGFEYTTARRGPAKQLNFLVEVHSDDSNAGGEPPEPTLNAEEHQAYAWVEEGDDLEKFPMSDSMRTVVQNALTQATAIYS
ncbi:NUDIX-domain-containing protein [Dendrothele bispora CBS 962.96]|uniref:NUDIX-domain-containing protein n=1 Tax=Dendrothele bispora (strain CBS 962.96) TaxID=1314807 RepID=A0A4S8LD65_DENBC|nr:NUDIX-domain-containing protein [Dendrothele bispora CBS 962.96]